MNARRLLLFSFALVSTTRVLYAQEARAWRPSLEIGAVLRSHYLDGSGAPDVRGRPGLLVGAGLARSVSARASIGASVRLITQSIELQESGAKWDAGRITDASVLATLSLSRSSARRIHASLDLGVGAAFISGADDTEPFTSLSTVSPTGEIGVGLHRTPRRARSTGRTQSLMVRWSVVRMQPNQPELSLNGGTASRLLISLGVTL